MSLAVFFVPVPMAFAGDMIAPPLLSYQVEPGEVFEYDLIFRSEQGGEYEVELRRFWFAEGGGQQFESAEDAVLSVESELFSFEANEQRYIPVKVSVPSDVELGSDHQYMVVLRKKSDEFHRYELASVLLFQYGKPTVFEGDVSGLSFVESDGEVKRLDYGFLNTTERYLELIPSLVIRDEEGVVLETFEGKVRIFFPDLMTDSSLSFLRDEDIVLDERSKSAEFFLKNTADEVVAYRELELPSGRLWKASGSLESPLMEFRERKGMRFLYHPIFRGFALLIGLTLLGGSFYFRRKG